MYTFVAVPRTSRGEVAGRIHNILASNRQNTTSPKIQQRYLTINKLVVSDRNNDVADIMDMQDIIGMHNKHHGFP